MEKPLLSALARKAPSRLPAWFMRQAGRYLPEYRAVRAQARDFMDFCCRPDLAIEATLQPLARFDLDAAIIFSDILVIPHALGQNVRFEAGEGPVLAPFQPDQIALNEGLEGIETRLAPVYEALSGTKARMRPETALIGFAGAPWTLAAYMIEGGGSKDFARARAYAYADPAGFANLLEILVDAIAIHLSAQIRAGADCVQIFDSWAASIPAAYFQDWAITPMRAIVARLRQAHPGVPIIAFPRGVGAAYPAFAQATGVEGIGVDWSADLPRLAPLIQSHACVQGALDPAWLLAGDGAARAQAVRANVDACRGGPFIFNLGHGVMPETPPERIGEILTIAREHYARKKA